MNITSASLVRTLAAPARPSRDSSDTWGMKVPSQAFDMPRICIWRGSAASRGLNGAVAAEKPADDRSDPWARVAEEDGEGITGGDGILSVLTDPNVPPTRHHVRVAVREDDHVPRDELDLLLAHDASVTTTFGQDVVGDQVLCGRHDPRRELPGRHGLGAPGLRRLDRVKVGAIQADNTQQV